MGIEFNGVPIEKLQTFQELGGNEKMLLDHEVAIQVLKNQHAIMDALVELLETDMAGSPGCYVGVCKVKIAELTSAKKECKQIIDACESEVLNED